MGFLKSIGPWLGPALVATIGTLLSQWFLVRLRRSRDRDKDDNRAWTDAGMAVQEICDDVVARFFDILVRKRPLDFDNFSSLQLAAQSALTNPSPELTTTFRIIKFLASATYLQRKLPTYGDVKRLRQADIYVSNKIRMAFKGNTAKSSLQIPTETQQCIGSKFLDSTPNKSPHELDFFRFIKTVQADDEARILADFTAAKLRFNPDLSQIAGEYVSLATALIYMIDFHQDLLGSSKWEEFRVFLVSVVRAWNHSTGSRAVYLYSPRDLSSDDYRSTFARLDAFGETEQQRNKRLKNRQRRNRSISAAGIQKRGSSQTVTLNFKDAPGDVLKSLEAAT